MKIAIAKKIKYNTFIFVLIIIPFFPLQSIAMLQQYDVIWNHVYDFLAILRCFFSICAICLFFLYKKRPSLLVKCICSLEVAVFVACVFNNSITPRFTITLCITTIGFAIICQLMCEKYENAFVECCTFLFGFISVVGALLIILFPNGFNFSSQKQYAIYLFGSKNAGFFYYAFYLFFKCYKSISQNRVISSKVIWLNILFIISSFICNSMNSVLMLMVILILIVIIKYKLVVRQLLKPKYVIFVVTLVMAMIPLLVAGKFEWFFQMIGRTSDLSMRKYIWESAIDMIIQNPLFGAGKDGDLVYFGRQTHAHNFFLDFASKYGLISLGIFIVSLLIITYKMSQSLKKELIFICSAFLLALLIHSLFDVKSIIQFVLFFVFMLKNELKVSR